MVYMLEVSGVPSPAMGIWLNKENLEKHINDEWHNPRNFSIIELKINDLLAVVDELAIKNEIISDQANEIKRLQDTLQLISECENYNSKGPF